METRALTGRIVRIRSALCAAVFVGALSALAVGGGSVATPAQAAPARQGQSSPTTSASNAGSPGSPVTTQNLLDGTPTTKAPATTVAPGTSPTTRVADDNRRVWLVVAGLVAVAVLLSLLTIWYWVRTRPATVAAERARPAGRDGAADAAGGNGRSASETSGSLRRSPPRPGGERSRGEPVPQARRRSEAPTRTDREAALRRARDLRH